MDATQSASTGVSRMRRLFTDPPLRERISWKDPLRTDTLITQDRALMARTFGTFFFAGSVFGLLVVTVGRDVNRDDLLMSVPVAIGLVIAAACFLGYRSLPRWFFLALPSLGIVLISISTLAASDGSEGMYAVAYVWTGFLSALFFSTRITVLTTLFAVAAYSSVMIALDVPFVSGYAIGMLFVIGAAGVVIGGLRSRLEGIASDLAVQAHTDTLTGLPNRRAFDERFELESNRAMLNGHQLSVAICDLDGFKQVNDKLGHHGGDEALKRASDAIRRAVRMVDGVARLGGEEFGVILPNASSAEAQQVGERVRQRVRQEFAGDRVKLTVSCGLASLNGSSNIGGLIEAADEALYRAKEDGRDRTVAYESFAESSTK